MAEDEEKSLRFNAVWEASGVLADLSVLTPPFLVCVAFLTAVAAFLRHEMRSAKKHDVDQTGQVGEPSDTEQAQDQGSGTATRNPADYAE
ncbi:MAG TPA: hypothetical protein VMA95_04025 [Streptosporangiaceae bacterium]|nr:hypothetical protein [Streptosporangiaceae bacterium]